MKDSNNKQIAIILGGYVNGYSIIQELHEKGVRELGLLYYKNQLASYSNKLIISQQIEKSSYSLLIALKEINKNYSFLVLFPTDDLQLEQLTQIYEEIKSFCFIPFNVEKVFEQSEKLTQYEYCAELGIPFPTTVELKKEKDVDSLSRLAFPFIIKPNKREDLKLNVFRNKVIQNDKELAEIEEKLISLIKESINFMASEIIPGDSSGNIYAYTAYRNKKGEILNEWVGKKLTQFPDDFGIFSSASNQAPQVVREQGRKLIAAMDITGICEPEFKFDPRDGQYKLMEINLRSMMWHRVGALSGVYLHYTQWLDALDKQPPKYTQKQNTTVHFSYLTHELINLVSRPKYLSLFKESMFGGNKNFLALYAKDDLLPFLTNLLPIPKGMVKAIIKRFLSRNRYA